MPLFALLITLAAPPDADRELLRAAERRQVAALEAAAPSLVGVVVSRSDLYPPADGGPGRLGGFDPVAFRQTSTRPDRNEVARRLDLSDPRAIPDNGYGGGVVVDPTGLVLTNYHTIDGASRVYVRLADGTGSYADIHAADARSDLAVLRLRRPPAGLKPLRPAGVRLTDGPGGRATVGPGKWVSVAGLGADTAFGPRPTGAWGTVTGVRTKAPGPPPDNPRQRGLYQYDSLVQHEVRHHAAMSGAVVLDLDGAFVGLTTTVAPPGGEPAVGYAVPMDDSYRGVVETLMKGEEVEYGFLGITMGSAGVRGVRLADVSRQSPADLAGLRPGDAVVRVADRDVLSADDLFLAVGSLRAGTRVVLGVRSDGRERDVPVTLAKLRHDQPAVASVRPADVFGLRVEWGSVLAQQLIGDTRVSPTGVPPGVVVRELAPGSPAAAGFAKLADLAGRAVITHVDGTAVATPAAFYAAARGKPAVTLTVADPADPDGKPRTLTLP